MNYFCFSQQIGSFFLSPAHGWRGARATIQNVSAPPSAEKIRVVQQAGKKKRGSGGNEFLLACSAARSAAWGGKRLRTLLPSREAKQNIFLFFQFWRASDASAYLLPKTLNV
jgi:hypothetical protein